MVKIYKIFTLLVGMTLLAGCSDNKKYEMSMCVLMDVSGTYAGEKDNVVRIIKAGILPKLLPGDSLFFITIDSNSYNEQNLIAQVSMGYVPSKANEKKLAFAKQLDDFARGKQGSKFTDISGAMLLCSDYLRSTGSGKRSILMFSDMKEELPKDVKRSFKKDEFDRVDIAAMNVIKLIKDTTDPEIYRDRLEAWNKRLANHGAKSWTVIADPVKIPEYIENLK